jgi:hypothetical protein
MLEQELGIQKGELAASVREREVTVNEERRKRDRDAAAVRAKRQILHHLYQRSAQGHTTQPYQHIEQLLCLALSTTESSWNLITKLVAFPSWRKIQRVKAAKLKESGFTESMPGAGQHQAFGTVSGYSRVRLRLPSRALVRFS